MARFVEVSCYETFGGRPDVKSDKYTVILNVDLIGYVFLQTYNNQNFGEVYFYDGAKIFWVDWSDALRLLQVVSMMVTPIPLDK